VRDDLLYSMTDWPQEAQEEYVRDVLSILFPNASEEASIQFGCEGSRFAISLLPHGLTELDQRYRTVGSRFVHFTSIRSLFSILNERALRMYDVTHANDPNEIGYWVQHFMDDQALLQGDPIQSLSKDLNRCRSQFGHLDPSVRQLEDRIQRIARFNSIRQTTTSLSMCSPLVLEPGNESALTLWRLYGDGGKGCAIKLEIGEPQDRRFVLGNVVYDALENEKSTRFKEAHRAFEMRYGEVPIEQVLAAPACLNKTVYYRIEQEVRLLRMGSYTESKDPASSEFLFEVNGRNHVVRYRRLPIAPDGPQPIKLCSIQFGFGVSEEQYRTLKGLVEKILKGWNGGIAYENIEVDISRSDLGPVYH
jgi:hypothetical protein